MLKRIFAFCALFACLTSSALAQAPATIGYQGILTDANGVAVPNGAQTITFRLYAAASGGSALWTETQTVTTTSGAFSAILGSITSLNISFNQPLYLGISVGSGAELTPRIALTASPYSLTAKTVEDGAVSSGKIADSAVTTVKIQDGAVSSAKIAGGAVTTTQIADNAVTGAKVAGGQVVKSVNSLTDAVTLAAGSNVTITPSGNTLTIAATGAALADNAVTTVKIADGAVTSAKIATGGVTTTQLADGTVATADLADNAVTGAKVASGQVVKSVNSLTDAVTLAAGSNLTITPSGNTLTIAATGAALADNAVTTVKIADGAVTSVKLATGGVTTTQISDGTIATADLADNGVTGAKITDGSIATAKIADNAVTGAKIAGGAVTATQIADNAVTGAKVAGGQVVKSVNTLKDDVTLAAGSNVTITPSGNTLTIAATGAALADNAVTTAKIADGAVTTVKIATGGVTTTQIADGTVATGDLTDNAVTSVKITDGAVATADIANNAVTTTQIADGTIATADLADNAVTGAKVVDGTVATADLADNSVTTAKIVDGTIAAGDIASGQVVKSVNTLKDDVTLAAGSNVTITPSGNTLTIASAGGAANTLDQAYDQGGAGAGRTITADAGAVNVAGADGLTVNGSVGIGTTSPTWPLHVYNNQNTQTALTVENPNTGTSALSRLLLYNNSTFAGISYGGSAHSSAPRALVIANNDASGDMRFATGGEGNERMRITSGGNIAIGSTTSPLSTSNRIGRNRSSAFIID